jgi:hypothetical protein
LNDFCQWILPSSVKLSTKTEFSFSIENLSSIEILRMKAKLCVVSNIMLSLSSNYSLSSFKSYSSSKPEDKEEENESFMSLDPAVLALFCINEM